MTVQGSEGEGGDPADDKLQINSLEILSRVPTHLAHGGNGGYQAMNLAALAGAARLVLLGFDMQHKGGQGNFHSEHRIRTPARYVKQWIPRFRELAKELARDGVEVINASEETALDAFPRRPIAELLPDPQGEA